MKAIARLQSIAATDTRAEAGKALQYFTKLLGKPKMNKSAESADWIIVVGKQKIPLSLQVMDDELIFGFDDLDYYNYKGFLNDEIAVDAGEKTLAAATTAQGLIKGFNKTISKLIPKLAADMEDDAALLKWFKGLATGGKE